MKNVARLAGVSTTTVSYTINQNRYVSAAIRIKVGQEINSSSAMAEKFYRN